MAGSIKFSKFFLIAIDWNFYNNHHILRWYEWDLHVFCKQTCLQLAAIWDFNSHISVVVCRFFEFGKISKGVLGKGLI